MEKFVTRKQNSKMKKNSNHQKGCIGHYDATFGNYKYKP